MTIKEIRDAFVAEYKYYQQAQGSKRPIPPDKLLALWISEAQQEIASTIRPNKEYVDIAVTSGMNSYALPSDFGMAISCEQDGKFLSKMRKDEYATTGAATDGEPLYFNISYTNRSWVITFAPEPLDSYTVRVWYYPEFNFYQPSEGATQNWGVFDGGTFVGNLQINPDFSVAIKYYLLQKAFPSSSFYAAYVGEMERLRNVTAVRQVDELRYNFGGFS